MFFGEFNNTVDPKGRASIPVAFREAMLKSTGDDSLYVTKNDRGLMAYPASSWKKICEKVNSLPPGPLRTANLRTKVAPAQECRFDKQGRIQVPQSLREYAALDKEIVVVGMIDKIEIWNLQRHLEATAESESLLRENEQAQADLGF
jgi:MraZ protein